MHSMFKKIVLSFQERMLNTGTIISQGNDGEW